MEVGSADESTLRVMQIGLHFGYRQASLEQQPAQPGLHRRFSRHRELSKSPQTSAPQPRCSVDQPRLERGIKGDECLDSREAETQIGKSSVNSRDPETADHSSFDDAVVANGKTSTRASLRVWRNDDLDWVNGIEVK